MIANSTSSDILEEHLPDAELVRVEGPHRCLRRLQEGEVDAYFGHDSFLYGMVATDPTVEVEADLLPGVDTQSNYGIAIAKDRLDLVRFVNVLDDLRTNGGRSCTRPGWKSRSASPMPSRRSRGTGTDMDVSDLDQALERLRPRPIGPVRTCSSSTSRPAVPCSPPARLEGVAQALAGGRRGAGRPVPVVRRLVRRGRGGRRHRGSSPTVPGSRRAELEQLLLGPSVELPAGGADRRA